MLAYITGTVDQELLLRNEYLAAESRFAELKCSRQPRTIPALSFVMAADARIHGWKTS
jgi:hypothetical protein